jgi:DNA (cytosine-5)-methyltransferase 1
MRYGNVCTGIGAPEVAWGPLMWEPIWFSEIEPFPCRLLKYHYPSVPNLGDMLKIEQNEIFRSSVIDLLVGGTPCQSFSIAGLRGGLGDSRGNLALEFCRILDAKRPRWFLWENVPGVLSSKTASKLDFATLLEAFRECGYSCAWRVLDAQFFGVPQRRRRVFVVGYLGDDWRPPAAVLFESEGLRRHIKTGGKKGKEITGTVGRRTGGCSIGAEEAAGGMLIVSSLTSRPYACNESRESNLIPVFPCWWDGGQISQTLDRVLSKGQTMPEKDRFPAVLTYPFNQITSKENRSNPIPGNPAGTLSKTDNSPLLIPDVRRLTPLECERLQGFPDNYTAVQGAKDSPRYQAIGNSMAVPVMAWIGRRIDLMDKHLNRSL